MIECECCGEEAIAKDYRPRKDLLKTGFKFDYRSLLTCYSTFLLCNECYHLSDARLYGRLEAKEKAVANKELQVV
jgi:hypothetical protein